jgi:DNA polymerase
MQRWFPGVAISRIHGQAKHVDGRVIVPMYHPAAALHRGDLRAVIEADFAKLPALVAEASGAAQPAAKPAPRTSSAAAAPPPGLEVGDRDQSRLL